MPMASTGCHTIDSIIYHDYYILLIFLRIERNSCTHALMSFCTGRCTPEIAFDSTISLPVSAQSPVAFTLARCTCSSPPCMEPWLGTVWACGASQGRCPEDAFARGLLQDVMSGMSQCHAIVRGKQGSDIKDTRPECR